MGKNKDLSVEKKTSVLALYKAYKNEGKKRTKRPTQKTLIQKTASSAKVSISSVKNILKQDRLGGKNL